MAAAAGGTASAVINEATVSLAPSDVATTPVEGQKPGTSGLRKKVKVFQEGAYLHNFIQSLFDSVPEEEKRGGTLVVSGDGRFYTDVAIQVIVKMAAANGIARVWVGQGGLLSTPAVSAVIRSREEGVAFGGIILSASHNPGGPEDDFGIKYNSGNGAPAPAGITNAIFERTKSITSYKICNEIPDVDLSTIGRNVFRDGESSFEVEVIDATDDYARVVLACFDVDEIRALVASPKFSFVFDGMHGVAGPYAERVFVRELGAPAASLLRCDPKPDFGGLHPDPNLTYAAELVARMCLDRSGEPLADVSADVPTLGAAADGDADRNMVLGSAFFVNPSDSLAVIAANADSIKLFREAGGLAGVARSMPTSCAVDRVAEAKGTTHFATPTGWKFFGTLMDSKEAYGKEDYTPFLCGEESFGMGSSHIREKDGLWAVLAWLSVVAHANKAALTDVDKALVTPADIVRDHWRQFGRNFYRRYDYEQVDAAGAGALMDGLRAKCEAFAAAKASNADHTEPAGEFQISHCAEFNYVDPVDGSEAKQQGIEFFFSDGSRVVWRLSGTGSVGATIRMYLEKYEAPAGGDERLLQSTAAALGSIVDAAVGICEMEKHTGRTEPTVIT